ncbi:ABC-type glycerol-3-phosphate transport system substrate-binding protein [Rhodococcus erythropolis]|nr:ABC-type glycerol-3-phosphate transport system substrate-binding protein [Rhodococcus erythropolis]
MANMNRRGFLSLGGAIAAGAALTACAGSGGSSADAAGTSGASGDSNTITFWSNHPGKSTDVEKELINRFQTKYPDLKVNLVDGGKNYEEVAQKFNAALSGGDVPDVVVLSDVWWFNYALAGAIEPLDGLFSEVGVDSADYVDSLLADYLFQGKHYALPYARSTPLFYYNKAVWSQAGLPDRGPATWQEFDEWGPELQKVVGNGKLAHGWGKREGLPRLDLRRPHLDLRRIVLRPVESAARQREDHCRRAVPLQHDSRQEVRRGLH